MYRSHETNVLQYLDVNGSNSVVIGTIVLLRITILRKMIVIKDASVWKLTVSFNFYLFLLFFYLTCSFNLQVTCKSTLLFNLQSHLRIIIIKIFTVPVISDSRLFVSGEPPRQIKSKINGN